MPLEFSEEKQIIQKAVQDVLKVMIEKKFKAGIQAYVEKTKTPFDNILWEAAKNDLLKELNEGVDGIKL